MGGFVASVGVSQSWMVSYGRDPQKGDECLKQCSAILGRDVSQRNNETLATCSGWCDMNSRGTWYGCSDKDALCYE